MHLSCGSLTGRALNSSSLVFLPSTPSHAFVLVIHGIYIYGVIIISILIITLVEWKACMCVLRDSMSRQIIPYFIFSLIQDHASLHDTTHHTKFNSVIDYLIVDVVRHWYEVLGYLGQDLWYTFSIDSHSVRQQQWESSEFLESVMIYELGNEPWCVLDARPK